MYSVLWLLLTFLCLSIKTVLLDLPSIVDSGQVKLPPGARKAPQSYTKLVIKGERLLSPVSVSLYICVVQG